MSAKHKTAGKSEKWVFESIDVNSAVRMREKIRRALFIVDNLPEKMLRPLFAVTRNLRPDQEKKDRALYSL